jgi:hypothetical protein
MHNNDSRNKVKLPFGLREGELLHISEVASGLACACRCAACNAKLVAKKGDRNTHHFAHYQEEECPHALETALHYAAKTVLQQSLEIALPELIIHEQVSGEVSGQKRTKSGRTSVCDMVVKKIDRVEVEKSLNKIVPDVIAYIDGQPLLIEIAVTHFIDEHKEQKINDIKINTVEIDLSDVDRSIGIDSIRKAVVDSISNKKWFFHSDEKTIRHQLKLKLESELKQELDAVFRQEQAKKKIEEEQRKLKQAKQARIRRVVDNCLKDAYQHLISNQQLELKYCQEILSQPLWLRSASIMDVSLETLPEFLNVPVNGEDIFACDRRVWQSGLFSSFIYNKFKKYDNPYSIRLDAMIEWCSEHVPLNKFALTLWAHKKILKSDELAVLALFDSYVAIREFVRHLEHAGFLKYAYRNRYAVIRDHWQAGPLIEAGDDLTVVDSCPAGLTEDEWEHFQERAGIHEFCGGLRHKEAERLAYMSLLSKNNQTLPVQHNGVN